MGPVQGPGSGLLKLMGIDTDLLEGNGVVDGETRLKEGDVTTAELVSSGAATPEQATLISGLFGQLMEMDAPVNPGKTFNDYLGDQGGFKGFMGDVVGEPILNNLFFGDDKDAYDTAVAGYQMDKKKYDSLWEIATAGKVQQAKNDAPDAQNTAVYNYIEGVINGEWEFDQRKYDALRGNAAGYKPVDTNDYSLAEGGQRRSGVTHELLAEGNARPDGYNDTSQEKNLAKYQEIMAREPADKTSPAWQAWRDELTFFETSVRANINDKGIIRSGQSGQSRGPVGAYVGDSVAMTSGVAGAEQDIETGARMFEESQAAANEAYHAVENYDYSLQNAYKVRDGLAAGKYNTNMARSMFLKNLGLGGYTDGELAAMGTDEAIAKVQGFNGHTTDFEYGEAFMGAFAQLKNGVAVNQGVMDAVIRGLENARENAGRALVTSTYDASSSARSEPEKRWVERKNSANKKLFPKAPDIGFERDGMRYMGGKPNNADNWVEISK